MSEYPTDTNPNMRAVITVHNLHKRVIMWARGELPALSFPQEITEANRLAGVLMNMRPNLAKAVTDPAFNLGKFLRHVRIPHTTELRGMSPEVRVEKLKKAHAAILRYAATLPYVPVRCHR